MKDSVAVAGAIGSGKTAFSCALAERLGCHRTSFGDFVRAEAARRGGGDSRPELQQLGELLIDEGWKKFCSGVLLEAGWTPGSCVVVDGIRHVEAMATLRELMHSHRLHLVFIETPDVVRAARVEARDGITTDAFETIDAHTVESQLKASVRAQAELIVDGRMPTAELVNHVESWLASMRA